MALDNAALLEVLEAMQADGVEDRVRTAAQTIYQALIDAELTSVIGAGLWERTEQRSAQRYGTRSRALSTTGGDLELRIPKLRAGSCFPSLLERRRRGDQALFAVVMEPTCRQRPVSVVVGKRKTGRRFPTRGGRTPAGIRPTVGPFEE